MKKLTNRELLAFLNTMSEEQLNRTFALNDDGQTIYINSVENRAKSLYAHPDDFCPEGCMTMEEWEEENQARKNRLELPLELNDLILMCEAGTPIISAFSIEKS